MTPSERLDLAIHLESAAIAPQTSELIEAAKEVRDENERLRAALRKIADEDPYLDDGHHFTHMAREALIALHQQQAMNPEEGK